MASTQPLRVAAVADLHYTRHSKGKCQHLFTAASEHADVLLLCGDLTDYGLPEEAALLAEDIHSHLGIPAVAVLGNHDFESGRHTEVEAILDKAGVHLLEEENFQIGDVGFAGVCGFGGGFGPRMLNAWGEAIIKAFVQEAVDQAIRLERSMARLGTKKKVVLLHYSPIRETVAGENEEIFPFLGSSRLEGPLNRLGAVVAFHGHAHNGAPEGVTTTGVPVFNVSLSVLERNQPDKPLFRVFEI